MIIFNLTNKKYCLYVTMNWTEENIETFIIEHKDKFNKCDASTYHENTFLRKLSVKFRILINIVPYLLRVILVWFFIAGISIYVWNATIRKDRHEITLKQKIENIITFKN